MGVGCDFNRRRVPSTFTRQMSTAFVSDRSYAPCTSTSAACSASFTSALTGSARSYANAGPCLLRGDRASRTTCHPRDSKLVHIRDPR